MLIQRRINVPCLVCGKVFARYLSEISKSGRNFCSLSCKGIAYRGKGNPKWRGGSTPAKGGYIYDYCPDHPYKNKDGYVLRHRLILESVLGRYLLPGEIAHHIDGDKNNNAPENLAVLSGQGEHNTAHAGPRKRRVELCMS